MIIVKLGDITQIEDVNYICNAANGVGPMGSGVAGAIRRAGGNRIQREAFKACKENDPKPGDIYTTNAGVLPYDKVIHLVTMKNPGGTTSIDVVEKCLDTLIRFCQRNNINKVAIPALGTGVGRLDKKEVAQTFKRKLEQIQDITFVVVDVDKEFISKF